MTTNTHEYIIGGGDAAKVRLNTLSEVLQPYTSSLLEKHGLHAGSHMLDAGCGGGNVSLMAAKIVGDSGSVTAIDFDEKIIALAQKDADEANVKNISFTAMSATDIDYQAEFDISYARFLLSHLKDPFTVLQKIIESTKPGGKVIVEDVHFSGHFCYPESDAFDAYIEYYTTIARNNGQNAEIGPSLFGLFRHAGLKNVGFDVIQPCFSKGAGKWMAYLTLDRIKDTVVEQKMATSATINDLLAELKHFTEDEQTIMSLPRIFRVWGERK